MNRQSLAITVALICVFLTCTVAFGQTKGATNQMQVTVHVVKSGDTSVWIAKDYGIDLAKLKQMNPGRDLSRLHAGDKLIVGEKAAEPQAAQPVIQDDIKPKNRPDKIALMMDEEKKSKSKDEGPGTAMTTVLMIVKLAIVLGLAYLTILMLKTLSDKRQSSPRIRREMRLVDTVRLSNASRLHLVELGGKTLLIGSSAGQVNLLTEVEQADEPSEEHLPDGKFAEHLARYSGENSRNTPAGRVAGLLRDCAAYIQDRRKGPAKTGTRNVGDNNEA